MIFDAVVLAGGRSSRLGGVPKADLVVDGSSLLSRALDAAAGARRIVVVGTPAAVPSGVLVTREDPAFGGPAAAIAAGMIALASPEPSDAVLVLACDLPACGPAVRALLETPPTDADGVIAIDSEGRSQYLLGLYRTSPLASAIELAGTGVHDSSVRALISPLRLDTLRVPAGSTDDIDTWEDAARHGIAQRRDRP